jgi:hypothetical protein
MRMLLFSLFLVTPLLSQEAIPPSKAISDEKTGVKWYDASLLEIEGKGWKNTALTYDRFPAKAEAMVPKSVWGLSRHSAGMAVRFQTEASSFQLKWSVTNERLAMPHMPATGVSGLDIYVRRATDGQWQWLSCGQPKQQNDNLHTVSTFAGKKEFLIYLPLYNGTKSLSIGLNSKEQLWPAPARPKEHQKPLLFYGTSITQGGCASRPGMVHTAILGRKLERPVLNFGFSGSGRMDEGVVQLLAELDPAIYIIDCSPNMDAAAITERTLPLVTTLRKARPETPILLVEDRSYTNSPVVEGSRKHNERNWAALKAQFEKIQAAKIPNVHYLEGAKLLGDDGEGTVDGSHPTDLGFLRQAEVMQKAIEPLLPKVNPRLSKVEGYTENLSYLPGESIDLYLSSAIPLVDLQLARVGHIQQEPLKLSGVAASLQPIPEDASAHGCKWKKTISVKIPENWKSGYYEFRAFEPGTTKLLSKPAFVIVRSAKPGQTSKMLLQLSTNTYNAYTNWGGYSLYAYHGRFGIQGRRVSFHRPQMSQFYQWEARFVDWAETHGYTLDYGANDDLEKPGFLDPYKLVLSVGHDEYWSKGMRDQLEAFIGKGGNVAFFSGNTCCWQVRPELNGKELVCWKQMAAFDPVYATSDHTTLSSLWSHHLVKNPENRLTGVGFLWGGYRKSHGQFMNDKAEYTVHRPDHWLFEKTNLKAGSTFGDKDTIVGYECDGCELEMKDGLPVPTGKDGTPKDFTILATCPTRWHPDDCEWYEKWQKGRIGQAVLGSYTRNGTVVTAGSTDWSHGLAGKDPIVEQITRNVLDRLGK